MIELNDPYLKFEIYYNGNKDTLPLTKAPNGWRELALGGEMDDFFGTVVEKLSGSMVFNGVGAKLIRQIFYTTGPNAQAALKIFKLQNDFSYSQIVFEDFDFSTFNNNGLTGEVTISLLDRGLMANVKAKLDTVFTIPVDTNPLAIPVNIGGIGVSESAQYTTAGIETPPGTASKNTIIPTVTINDNTTHEDFVITNSDYDTIAINLGDDFGLSYFADFTVNVPEVRFKGSVKAYLSYYFPTDARIDFYLINNNGTGSLLRTVYNSAPGYSLGHNNPIEFNYDITRSVLNGEKYTIGALYNGGDYLLVGSTGGDRTITFDEIVMDFSYNAYTQDYHAKGLRTFDLFSALMQKINPGTALNIKSDLLTTGKFARHISLSGDCIRGIKGATINTSFRDCLTSLNAQLFAAFKIYKDNTIRLEKKKYYYNPAVKAGHLGKISGVKYSSLNSYFYQTLTIGQENQTYENVDGKDEVCTEECRSIESVRFSNTLNKKSVWRTDARGIDQLIIDFRNNVTTDTKSDTEVFNAIINETPTDGFYGFTGPEQFAKVEGVSALGRIYNLDFAPMFNLSRSSAELGIPFALSQIGQIDFQSSKKNANLKITFNDGSVRSEIDPLTFEQMDQPLFLPIIADGTIAITDDQYNQVISDAQELNGCVTFEDKGVIMEVFINTYSYNLTEDNKREFKFYLSPLSPLPPL